MFGKAAFITSMVVLAACDWMIEQGGMWLVAGVVVGVPAALVWCAGIVLGVLELLER